MPTLKLTLAYDGTEYVGWQRQANGISIQAVLEDALEPIEGGRVTVVGAGRTDAGVHALGQVASVSLAATIEPHRLQRALNAVLPRDVRVVSVDEAETGFHARFSAIGKVYEYRIVNAPFVSPFLHRYVWHVATPLDVEAMQAGAVHCLGRHDFASFQATGSNVHTTERTVQAIEWVAGLPLTLRIRGDGFLRHMVRNIVGTLVEVGAGRWPPDRVRELLAARDRTKAGPAAPPRGLFLVDVLY